MHGAAPERVNVFERLAAIFHIELGAFVAVLHVKLAIAVVVAIFHLQIRKAEIRHV